jgi:hypothetical protein
MIGRGRKCCGPILRNRSFAALSRGEIGSLHCADALTVLCRVHVEPQCLSPKGRRKLTKAFASSRTATCALVAAIRAPQFYKFNSQIMVALERRGYFQRRKSGTHRNATGKINIGRTTPV